MDLSQLHRILKDAYLNVLPFVYQFIPQRRLYTIWRSTENGAAASAMALPNAMAIFDPFKEALEAGVLDEVTDYLWEHGAARVTLTAPDPNREAWTRWTVYTVIRPIVVQWLEDMFIIEACSGQPSPTWPVPGDGMLNELARMHARLLAEDEVSVNAYYFIPAFQLPASQDCIMLGGDITLRNLPRDEWNILLSQSASSLLWDDMFGLTPTDTLCEIKMWVRQSESEMDIITDRITEKLNILKLALTLIQPNQWKNGEGIVLMSIQSPKAYRHTSRMLRRRTTQWAGFQADDEVLEQLRGHVEAIEQSVENSQELRSALWRFGRACSTDLPQDQLVEAVVGMESLLLPNAGESTYRFGLHGVVLLYSLADDGTQLYKQLQGLYRQRSAGVHGAGRRASIERDVDKAVVHFAHLIRKIMALHAEDKLPHADSIAKSIERLVLLRATAGNPQ